MAEWQRSIAEMAEMVEHQIDRAKRAVKRSLGVRDPLVIAAYIGYANGRRVFLHGRVLEQEGIRSPVDGDDIWDNLRMMYRRFESDEIPGAEVELQLAQHREVLTANDEGFFRVDLQFARELEGHEPWQEAQFKLLKPVREGEEEVRATGSFIRTLPQTRFGIISDIDDTVVHTDNSSLVRMARIVYLGNARTRLPFAGVTEFYKALNAGAGGNEHNPIFYVSSSPWNLYDLFRDFLEIQQIPLGPLMLRDWGLTAKELLPSGHKEYKLGVIRNILDFYPDLPFILIGDSGQEDPEIYCSIVEHYHSRIWAAYVRQVGGRESRIETIRELFRRSAHSGTSFQLVPDTEAAAEHAAENGWIRKEALQAIAAEVRRDTAEAGSDSDIVNDRRDR